MHCNTKKFFSFLLIGILTSSIVFAIDDEPRLTPSSNIYGLKIAWEKITEVFKPSLKAEHAQERLRELVVVNKKGDSEAAQKLIEKIRERQKEGLLKSEEVDKVQREYNSKFNIDYMKLKEAINTDEKYTSALKQYSGVVALFVKYPGENDQTIKLVVDKDGKVSDISKVDKLDVYDFYFNLSHGQLYAYSQQIIEKRGNLASLLKVAGSIGGKR